ncbi:hypothetical protein PVAP13_4KG179433 [Panicum virgatum]|uniref:Zinc finger GRF-type domain-containing protein n=1 Tax=Panicum virgatum TaxID=38727 RepID=A0A8T0TMI2_PANVG|nr:hypothetical protein PVAP13_4KG179433 [Panicum virgatum]
MGPHVSSSPGHGSSSGDGVRHYSPIPYRRGSFDYEPSVLCQCGRKAGLWISWSNDNPGRRYLKCYNAHSGGCNFMGWFEGPVHKFVRGLLIDLRDTVWGLKRERVELKAALADAVVKMEQQKEEISALKVENEALKAANKASAQKSLMKTVLLIGLAVLAAAAAVFMRLG